MAPKNTSKKFSYKDYNVSEEKQYLAWDWTKNDFVKASEINKKQRPPLWTKSEPPPTYPATAIVDKESLIPEGFSDLPFVTEDMEGLEVVIWDVRVKQWVEGQIEEVYLNLVSGQLTYIVVATNNGKLRTYALDQVKIQQQTQCTVEVAA